MSNPVTIVYCSPDRFQEAKDVEHVVKIYAKPWLPTGTLLAYTGDAATKRDIDRVKGYLKQAFYQYLRKQLIKAEKYDVNSSAGDQSVG